MQGVATPTAPRSRMGGEAFTMGGAALPVPSSHAWSWTFISAPACWRSSRRIACQLFFAHVFQPDLQLAGPQMIDRGLPVRLAQPGELLQPRHLFPAVEAHRPGRGDTCGHRRRWCSDLLNRADLPAQRPPRTRQRSGTVHPGPTARRAP